jgi:hypothetical protein
MLRCRRRVVCSSYASFRSAEYSIVIYLLYLAAGQVLRQSCNLLAMHPIRVAHVKLLAHVCNQLEAPSPRDDRQLCWISSSGCHDQNKVSNNQGTVFVLSNWALLVVWFVNKMSTAQSNTCGSGFPVSWWLLNWQKRQGTTSGWEWQKYMKLNCKWRSNKKTW